MKVTRTRHLHHQRTSWFSAITLIVMATAETSSRQKKALLFVTPLSRTSDQSSLRQTLELPSDPSESVPVVPSPLIVGHRGALYQELENTRAGFLACAAMGCHAVELDVFRIRDGNLVVFHGGGTDEHPGSLDEYCLDQKGVNIMDLTYEECAQLRFDPEFEEFVCPTEKITSAYIPTLEQVLLDLKDTPCNVKIELKGPNTVIPVLELVEKLGMVRQCSYSSFDWERLQLLRSLRPQRHEYVTGALFNQVPEDYLELALACGASEVHLRYDTCTVSRVKEIHRAGLGSMAWMRGPRGMAHDTRHKYVDVGNEDDTCYRVIMQTGVQQLCVNRPDVALRLLN